MNRLDYAQEANDEYPRTGWVFGPANKTNQTNAMNEINQIDQTDQIDSLSERSASHPALLSLHIHSSFTL
jgi:hypothetical protein